MQFCKDCGNALNIFTLGEQEFCSLCLREQKKERDRLADAATVAPVSLLEETHIEVVDKRIILRSKEGWELWSSPTSRVTELRSILARATRIYQIRMRRQKSEGK